MTALEKYIRLEAVGHWRDSADAPLKEVIVSFGDNTLQLTTLNDTPLGHWALLATRKIGMDRDTITYSADPDGGETLEISDPDMNAAIAAVTAAINRRPPRPPLLRWLFRLAGILVLVALAQQAPALIYRWAATLTPPARADDISAAMLTEITNLHGPECRNWQPYRDLAALTAEIWFTNAPDVVVLQMEPLQATSLPDGTIIVSSNALQGSPAEFASLLILQWAMTERNAALEAAIANLGPVKAMRYLIGGNTAGINSAPVLAMRATGTDFVVARNALANAYWPTQALQDMAKAQDIGLPIREQANPPFQPNGEIWQSIRQICANNTDN